MSETLSAIVSGARKARGAPALHVGLWADAPGTAPMRVGLAGIDRVDIGRADARRVERRRSGGADLVEIALADSRLSTQHARLTRLGGSWVIEDLGSKNGTWLGGVRVERRPVADGDAILVGHTMLVFRDAGGEAGDADGPTASPAPGLATMSPGLVTRFAELARASTAAVPIEITGETGTGKELVARAVHALSRRTGRFIAVNCGALPGALLEGELFGHKKGAYTGATDDRAGLIRSADGGTLFLDEIGELPAASQAALLRVLQEGEVLPLGADRAIKVDLRIVTATHRDLAAEVDANRFRADLRARLLGVSVELPPLRDRREDLGLVIAALLDRIAPGRALAFSADAASALYAHGWPLNIRELERALTAAAAVATDRIQLEHLPAAVRTAATAPDEPVVDIPALSVEDRALRVALSAAIARHDGNLTAVAKELGKDRTQIRRWMKRFGLSRAAGSED